ncbi:hypothetical protein L227DRAFT_172087 [Lentinus tigrinus ALCF2SS1-6]|uniref:Uncharacterized protein n=1 Tax=Lentinus tigrinus ALCF2SS1-6 TaxID=1328759 RepID=A0A5C2S5G8_9APHY|nr:hypothetical protein L227DRAFT_172087 [Lentinus tigrinus ALCF2SS1-6]
MGSVISAIILAPVGILAFVAYAACAVVGTVFNIIGIIAGAIIDLLCAPFLLCYLMCFADDEEDFDSWRANRARRRSGQSSDITEKPGDASGRSLHHTNSIDSFLDRLARGNRPSDLTHATSRTSTTLHE